MADDKCPKCGAVMADQPDDQDDIVCTRTGGPECLRRQLAEAKPYMNALRNRHNGYKAEYREAMPDFKEPATPEQALDELIEEANAQGVTEGRMELAEAKAARETAEAAALAMQQLPHTWHRCGPTRKVRPWPAVACSMHKIDEAEDFDALTALEQAEAALATPDIYVGRITEAVEKDRDAAVKRAETAEAACAAILKAAKLARGAISSNYMGEAYQAGKAAQMAKARLYLDPVCDRPNPGQALLDERDHYRKGLEIIRDCFPCSCCDELGRCSRCEAVAALDEKETPHAE